MANGEIKPKAEGQFKVVPKKESGLTTWRRKRMIKQLAQEEKKARKYEQEEKIKDRIEYLRSKRKPSDHKTLKALGKGLLHTGEYILIPKNSVKVKNVKKKARKKTKRVRKPKVRKPEPTFVIRKGKLIQIS